MLRIVLDTSVLVATLRSRLGASNEVLRLVARKRVVALATPALFLEYEDVLMRPEQRVAHGLNVREVDRLLSALATVIEPVTVHIAWRPQLRDPSDEMVLEAAINGRADALVTFNVNDFQPAKRFGLPVVRPVEILGMVKS
ncbi:MAG: putative toxin-antitoxin system toxin component, PIN family [Rhodospirillales bacterium]|nr:putative toxin-antitoxin system toxin component, PIN family [Rhodospirillales bacterium]